MDITSYKSKKIAAINMLLIILVLVLHGYYVEANNFPIANAMQEVVGTNGLTGVAVPMFFLLSGILFFKGVDSAKDCLPKIKKRVRSLLVPYLIWNVVFVLWYLILQNLPGVGGYINNDIVGKVFTKDVGSDIYELLWKPVNFPLWFLRDLMIMVALSPILFYLIKYLKWGSPLLILLASPYVNFNVSPFFLLGGCIAIHSNLEKIDSKLAGGGIMTIVTLIYFGNAITRLFTDYNHPYVSFIVYLCGVISIWRLYDMFYIFYVKKPVFLNRILGYSFFIYLFHEPVFNIIKKVNLRILGEHEWSLILLYFMNPIIMCVISVAVAKFMQNLIPKTYSVLVGGRSFPN